MTKSRKTYSKIKFDFFSKFLEKFCTEIQLANPGTGRVSRQALAEIIVTQRTSFRRCVYSTYLYDVIAGDVHLQVVFAVGLQAVVGETVVVWSGEQVE